MNTDTQLWNVKLSFDQLWKHLNSFQWNHLCFSMLSLFTTRVRMLQKAKRASKEQLIKFVEASWPGKRKKVDDMGRQHGLEREKRAKYEQELCPEWVLNKQWWENREELVHSKIMTCKLCIDHCKQICFNKHLNKYEITWINGVVCYKVQNECRQICSSRKSVRQPKPAWSGRPNVQQINFFSQKVCTCEITYFGL